jgi:MFS transporter, ACS family, tartrate transporter
MERDMTTTERSPLPPPAAFELHVVSKVKRRLLPFLIACFFVAFLDRVNVGFAALQMNVQLGLTPRAFGLGAGLFFLGYFLFEIPSNLMLHRIGARIWISRIMTTWGILACLAAFAYGQTSFLVLRFLLGVAEAGFFPGVLLYFSLWFPAGSRAGVMATFSLGSVVSLVVAPPISAYLLRLDGIAGLHGWQWLFLLEGAPSIAFGVAAFFFLTDCPERATWLNRDERGWLTSTLLVQADSQGSVQHNSVLQSLLAPQTVLLAFAAMANIIAMYGVTMWLPQIVKSAGILTDLQVGFVTSLPFLCAAIAMKINGAHSDRTGEQRWHILLWAIAGTAGFVLAATAGNAWIGLSGICLAAMGIWCANTVFWVVPMRLFTGVSAAANLALINSIGNLGGFVGPYLTGEIRQLSGDYAAALLTLGGSLTLCGILMFFFLQKQEPVPPRLHIT